MKERQSKSEAQAEPQAAQSLSPMDFSTFILSLASSAMIQLGIVDGQSTPETSAAEPTDLVAAKQLIDIIGVLERKTQGNLSDPEDRLLKSLLYDLRVHYCDASRCGAKAGEDDSQAKAKPTGDKPKPLTETKNA